MCRLVGILLTIPFLVPLLGPVPLNAQENDCVGCHEENSPGIVADWRASRHSQMGVDCATCHRGAHTTAGTPDETGMPTAETCAMCHQNRVDEFIGTAHTIDREGGIGTTGGQEFQVVIVACADPDLIYRTPGRLLTRLIPRGASIFILDLDAQTVRSRRQDLRTDRRLVDRLKAYRHIALALDLPRRCTGQPPIGWRLRNRARSSAMQRVTSTQTGTMTLWAGGSGGTSGLPSPQRGSMPREGLSRPRALGPR